MALDLLNAATFDIIFSDGSMPVMDGYTFAAKLREREMTERRARTPLIAVSAHALAEDENRFLDVGMDGYISKPVTLAKLAGCLRKWMPDVPVVDESSLDDMRAYISPEAFRDIVASSLVTLGEFSEQLAMQLAGAELPGARVTAHSMKGLARQLGASRLAETVEQMEKRVDDVASAMILLPELDRRLVEARAVLADLTRG